MRLVSNSLNALSLASSRPIQESGDDVLTVPAVILPTVELQEPFRAPNTFFVTQDDGSGITSISQIVANQPATSVPFVTFGRGLYDITVYVSYDANYSSTSRGSGGRDYALIMSGPTGVVSRDIIDLFALNSAQFVEIKFRALFAEPGFTLNARLETNTVGQAHHANSCVIFNRLVG